MATYDEAKSKRMWTNLRRLEESMEAWTREVSSFSTDGEKEIRTLNSLRWAAIYASNLFEAFRAEQQAFSQTPALLQQPLPQQPDAVDRAIAARAAAESRVDREKEVADLLERGHLSAAACMLEKLGAKAAAADSIVGAIRYWGEAAKLYLAEGAISRYCGCKAQIANARAENGEYADAIAEYEEIGGRCDAEELLKWGSKKYYLLAVACRLATDDVEAAYSALVKYQRCPDKGEPKNMFAGSREFRLASNVTCCRNLDDFDKEVADYEAAVPIDPLCRRLLMRYRCQRANRRADDPKNLA